MLTFPGSYEKQGKHSRRRGGDDAGLAGRPLSDADFEAAINSLEASTAAIEQQSKLLQSQKHAFQELKSRHSSNSIPSQGHEKRSKRLAREKTQFEFEGNELSESIRLRLQSLQKQTDSSSIGIPSAVDRILDKDDRLLDGLQTVIPKLNTTDQSDCHMAEVERLCQSLAVLSTREIRARIDATYTSTLASATNPENTTHEDEEDKAHTDALRAELNELSTEISSLAAMAVDTHHRIPLTRALSARRIHTQNDQANWTLYIADMLQQLTARLEALEEHIQHLHIHRAALSHASTIFDTISAIPNNRRQSSADKPSPARQFQKTLKPLRVTQMQGGHGSNNSQQQQSHHDPTNALLRNLEIRNPTTANHFTDPTILPSTLVNTVRTRSTRLTELENTTERAITDQIAAALSAVDRDQMDLLRAVHLHAPYARVRLEDGESRGMVEALEASTQDLGRAMRGLDVGKIADEAIEGLQEKGLL